MFKSKRRQIVTPQSEHLKLVGTLAMLWGNKDFDVPSIERNSMIAGMGLHDRGYGYLDNSPIGDMRDDEWEVIARRGFTMAWSDVIADTIVKYHFRRLASDETSEIRKALHAEFSKSIDQQLKQHNLSKTLFDRMDRTLICATGFHSNSVSMRPLAAVYPSSHATTKIQKSLSIIMSITARSMSHPGLSQSMSIEAIWSPIKRMGILNGSTLQFCRIGLRGNNAKTVS